MQMRPKRCDGRLRTANLAWLPTASAFWPALRQLGVSANRAKLALTRRSVTSNIEVLAACPYTATPCWDSPHWALVRIRTPPRTSNGLGTLPEIRRLTIQACFRLLETWR